MRRIVICVLLLLATLGGSPLYAQLQGQARIDSLLRELTKQKDDTNKVRLLNDLSYSYRIISPNEGIIYGLQQKELTIKLQWKKGMAAAYTNLGVNYNAKGEYSKALTYYDTALKKNEEQKNKKGIATAYINIAGIYNKQSDYPNALVYNFRSLKIAEDIGDKGLVAGIYLNVCNIYIMQEDYTVALAYATKALKIAEEQSDKKRMVTAYNLIGNIYEPQKDYPRALENYLKTLDLATEIGHKQAVGVALSNLGNTYTKQKNYAMAIENYQKALKINEEMGDERGRSITFCNIGFCFLSIVKNIDANTSPGKTFSNKVSRNNEHSVNKYQPTGTIPSGKEALLRNAIDYSQRSLAICKRLQTLDLMTEVYKNLAEAYKLSGDFKRSLEASDNAHAIKDSVFSKENRGKITKLENKRKEFADSLNAEEAKKMASVKAAHRRNYELIGGAAFVLLLGFVFLLKKNNRLLDKEKKENETLLHNILPEEVASQLKNTGKSAAKQFDDVTVLFTDFVNFTEASERMMPESLIEELDTCFKAFDGITARHNIEKIKTIGDAYLAVCGLPTPDPKHAENVVRAATEINAFMADRLSKMGSDRTFAVRIGVHTGSVVAGIVGTRKFAYDIWGDTVNTAARMEQNSEAGKINISETTYELVNDKFKCEYRGEVEVKGKGGMKMYFVS